MKKTVVIFMIIFACVNGFAPPANSAIIIASAAAAANRASNNNGNSANCETFLEGTRYVIIAVNNYSNTMTAYDKIGHTVFDFSYLANGSRYNCIPGWGISCHSQNVSNEVMNDVFGIVGQP